MPSDSRYIREFFCPEILLAVSGTTLQKFDTICQKKNQCVINIAENIVCQLSNPRQFFAVVV